MYYIFQPFFTIFNLKKKSSLIIPIAAAYVLYLMLGDVEGFQIENRIFRSDK